VKTKPSHKLNQRYKTRRNPKYEVRSVRVLPKSVRSMSEYFSADIKIGGKEATDAVEMAKYFINNEEIGVTPYIAFVDVMCTDMNRKPRVPTNNKKTITMVSFRVDEMEMYKTVKAVMPVYWRRANKINRYR